MCTYMHKVEDEESQTEEWVACHRCHSWYHKQCVGIGFRFGRKNPFLHCGTDDSSM